MTEVVSPSDAAAIWARIVERDAARQRILAETQPRNMAAIFEALAAASITSVIVVFDGYGDSGQVDSIDARNGDAPVDMPAAEIGFADIANADCSISVRQLPVADAIEALVYHLLYETHAGWENNDGAYGEFTFDVNACSIALDHNSRFTDVESFEHRW
jgi:hypothetical protein